MSNEDFYKSEKAVARYDHIYLDKPELAILCRLEERLPRMRMLDIGIGSGRTTHYFAGLAQEYYGIDYSQRLVDHCKQKYPQYAISFGDARSLKAYEDGYLDFVLFSFNGLDSISPDERLVALSEIRRVLKPGGFFAFSSHNMQHVDRLFKVGSTREPIKFLYYLYRNLRLRFNNRRPDEIKAGAYALIKDGNPNFRFETYYIGPSEQIRQLESIGFKNVRVLSLNDGREIPPGEALDHARDWWLYYLCEA